MTDEMVANPKLMDEYENTFDSEEKLSNSLKISKDSFTIDIGVVEFDSLLIPEPLKKGRKETYLGLSTSIAEMGIISPIHVMVTEGYEDFVKENPGEEYEGYKYAVLDGFRRVWGGYKNGLKRCNAVIWDFKDKDRGTELSTVLSLILNKIQRRSWGEIWYMLKILEAQSSLTPGTLEYLLQLESGDSMKLKDIMMCDYDDVKEALLTNKKDITQCYNMLQKYRKEEDKLLKDDNTGIADVEQAEGLIDKADDTKLSDEDVKEILEMDGDDLELQDDNFDEMLQESDEYETQTVGDRHELDSAIKAETLMRDGYNCVCCDTAKYLPMRYKLTLLQSHHKISVSNGGPDAPDNIATLCVGCHTLVHTLLWSGLRFKMKKEDFDELPESEQSKLKKIMRIAKYDIDAAKRRGKTEEQIRKDNQRPSTFKMPGTDLRENAKALQGKVSIEE